MRYTNRLFPHPVLGIEDDVTGDFKVELTYQSDKENITLGALIKLSEPSLERFISEGRASVFIQLYCRGTMYREVFERKYPLAEPVVVKANKLSGEVEVDFFVCAKQPLSEYSSKAFNREYGNFRFQIDETDILAYAGKGKFIANKSPQEQKSISSLFRIRNSHKKRKPMYNEYESNKVEIMLCEEDYETYQLISRNRLLVGVIHSSIVLPALLDALNFLESDESANYKDRRWYTVLKELKEKSTSTTDNLQIAQNILDLPIDRTLSALVDFNQE